MNHAVWNIARVEFLMNVRNRWVISFSVLFMLLTFTTAYFGMVTSGYAGFQDFIRTSASLINICGFLLPLFALILGVFSFISNREFIEFLITQPMYRTQFMWGKYVGLSLTFVGTTLLGFGMPGVVMALRVGSEGALSYAYMVLFSILLGLVFIGLSILVSLWFRLQQITIGIVIGIWLSFEVIYGLALLGGTLFFPAAVMKPALVIMLIGNPIDIVRVTSLLVMAGPHFFGPAGASLIKMSGSNLSAGLYASAALLFWILWPLIGSILRIKRMDI